MEDSIIWIISILGVAIFSVLSTLATLLFFKVRNRKKDPSDTRHWVLTDDITRSNLNISTRDGSVLAGYLYEAQNGPVPGEGVTIIFLHGLSGYAQDIHFEKLLSSLALGGCRVFAYDHRLHGNSPGSLAKDVSPQFFKKAFLEDSQDVLQFVKEHPSTNISKLVAVGFSFGGSILLAPPFLEDKDIRLMVSGCAFHEIDRSWELIMKEAPLTYRALFWYIFKKAPYPIKDFLKAVGAVSAREFAKLYNPESKKICLIHCKNDKVVDYSLNFIGNRDALNIPAEQTLVFERGGHEMAGVEPAVTSRILFWIQKWIDN